MFDRLRELLRGDAQPAWSMPDTKQLAVAGLLIAAASQDGAFDAAERETVERLLAGHFELDDRAAATLLGQGEAAAEQAVDLHRFVTTINQQLSSTERTELVEMLWEVVYADGALGREEDALMRRVGALLGVSDFDRGAARKRVLARRDDNQATG